MRFRSNNMATKSGLSRRDRLRLWSLMGCLALVLLAMNQLRKPETAQRLDRVFGVQEQPVETQDSTSSPSDSAEETEPLVLGQPSEPETPNELSSASSDIEDNTFFRPAEGPRWFEAFRRMQTKTVAQLADESVGEITYAQLLEQPDEYRHRVVTIRGTALREEALQPADNAIGIDSYHRLWISPEGGGQWPFVVYCRNLPPKFPRGDDLRESIAVHGEFFKVWSYRYDEGLGLAPVILTHEIDWRQPVRAVAPDQFPVKEMIWAATATGVFALVVVWIAFRHTARRPRHLAQLPATFQPPESFRETDSEGHE